MTTTISRSGPTPTQLIFDDGSRIMSEPCNTKSVLPTFANAGRDQSISIRDYYEIDRIVQEIQCLVSMKQKKEESSTKDTVVNNQQHGHDNIYLFRIALQFPDELLIDAPDVCWEYEQSIHCDNMLVFCLGDTTYAPCCPDIAAAAHLDADCIVHYGHACFSPCHGIPVLYSFGGQPKVPVVPTDGISNIPQPNIFVECCKNDVLSYIKDSKPDIRRILLMYEVRYHYMIDDLAQALQEEGELMIVTAKIPQNCHSEACMDNGGSEFLKQESNDDNNPNYDSAHSLEQTHGERAIQHKTASESFVLGGLELPNGIDWSYYSLLFVGSDVCRQFMNIALRFLSVSKRPQDFWTWRPALCTTSSIDSSSFVKVQDYTSFSTVLSESFQRKLNRRFYLIQKAKQCSIFGILVANLSDTRIRLIVQSLSKLIEYDSHSNTISATGNGYEDSAIKKCGRTSYTFMVGKINPSKLANFAEIQCFVLVACSEHSLLDSDSDFHVPVITPLELCMALGVTEWGEVDYSLDTRDYFTLLSKPSLNQQNASDGVIATDNDEPYFSVVTGKYESTTSSRRDVTGIDLTALPGQGKLTEYRSAAAEFLKDREYQGLVLGRTDDEEEAKAAQPGLVGIASNYNNR